MSIAETKIDYIDEYSYNSNFDSWDTIVERDINEYTYQGYLSGMKETKFYLPNCEGLDDESIELLFFPNKYFTAIDIHDDEFKGSTLSLRLISIIISNELMNVVKTHKYYHKFVKIFFKHLVDIMYWVNKYKITEVYDFLRNMLTLRQPTKISPISNIEYIMINGGSNFIYRILGEIVSQKTYHKRVKKNDKLKDHIDSIKHNLVKENQDDKETVKQFISKHDDNKYFVYEERDMFKKIMDHVTFCRGNKYFKNLDKFPECDMNLVVSPNQKVYSHFLWVYGEMTEYVYNLRQHELPNNDFYNLMLTKLSILPDDLAEMLKANLYVLSQVAA
jgi:hypothetical protein